MARPIKLSSPLSGADRRGWFRMKGVSSMTGRDLIVYILSNNLENEEVFKDGKFIGFITAGEAAVKLNVGIPTICVWLSQKKLDGVKIGDTIYISADCERPTNKEE